MALNIKNKSISVENYESNVFNESNEIVDFYGTDSVEKEDVEDLIQNKRVRLKLNITPKINKIFKTKSLHSLDGTDSFSDQLIKTVNIIEHSPPKVSYGVFQTKNDNVFVSKKEEVSNSNTISLNLLGKQLNEIEEFYPFVVDFNADQISKKGYCIDPFNLYKEITRDIITEFNEKGLSASSSTSGALDCRKRSINISNVYFKNNEKIEPYDDQKEPDDIMTEFGTQKYYLNNFFKVSLVNGIETYNIDQSRVRFKSSTSKESRYLSNESNKLEPFVEKENNVSNADSYLSIKENRFFIRSSLIEQFYLNKDKTITRIVYNNVRNDVKHLSSGFSNDYSKTQGIESISFRGRVK